MSTGSIAYNHKLNPSGLQSLKRRGVAVVGVRGIFICRQHGDARAVAAGQIPERAARNFVVDAVVSASVEENRATYVTFWYR